MNNNNHLPPLSPLAHGYQANTMVDDLRPPLHGSANRIPLTLGMQKDGRPLLTDLATLPHLLVAGSHAGEAEAALHPLLLSLQLQQREGTIQLSFNTCTEENRESLLAFLQQSARKATDRLRFFTIAGVSGIDGFNTRSPETLYSPKLEKYLPGPMERHVLVLHNPGELLRYAPQEARAAFWKLGKATSHSQFAPRDAGIHLILSCDAPTRKNLPNELLKLIPARMVLRTPSSRRLLAGLPAGQKRLRDGEFRFRAHEGAPCITATCPAAREVTPLQADSVC